MEALQERATFTKESMVKSQIITDTIVRILGSLDSRLSALETAMRPTQVRTVSIRKAHENIDKSLKAVEVIVSEFDLARKAEAKIPRGPYEDLESYSEAIDQLRSILKFFTSNKSYKGTDAIVNHCTQILTKAISKLEDEFRTLLANYRHIYVPLLLITFLTIFIPVGQLNKGA